eukprot:6757981-Lingulodinium_polyedra.AAC.1
MPEARHLRAGDVAERTPIGLGVLLATLRELAQAVGHLLRDAQRAKVPLQQLLDAEAVPDALVALWAVD